MQWNCRRCSNYIFILSWLNTWLQRIGQRQLFKRDGGSVTCWLFCYLRVPLPTSIMLHEVYEAFIEDNNNVGITDHLCSKASAFSTQMINNAKRAHMGYHHHVSQHDKENKNVRKKNTQHYSPVLCWLPWNVMWANFRWHVSIYQGVQYIHQWNSSYSHPQTSFQPQRYDVVFMKPVHRNKTNVTWTPDILP